MTLKPLTHPEIGEIVLRDDLFSIGCNEAPFTALPEGAVAGLSSRHAKIIRQQGALYVVDLGSRGGTTVNGRAVHKRAVPIQNGDTVCFAGKLCFQAETCEQDLPEPDLSYEPLTLVLVPASDETQLEPIVVDQFPFLVGKDVGVFSGYKTRFPEQSRYISRRHALIFLRQDSLYVEDLGSTNGTFLAGQLLAEGAARLEDGARIAFGGEFFSYRIDLGRVAAEEFGQEPGTIFVTAADSFLDAFCPEADARSDSDAVASGERSAEVPVQADRSAGKSRRAGPLRRLNVFLSEIRGAFSDEDADRPERRWGWWFLAVGLLVVAVSLGIYLTGTPERDIRDLMTAGRYADGANLASRYLKDHPGNERIELLGTESMSRHVVPTWIARMDKGDIDGADHVLKQAARLSRFNDDAKKMLQLLEWAGRLERFMSKRGGPQAPIVIFQDEPTINRLIDWWEDDARGHRNLLTRLMDYVPDFRPMGSRLSSHLVSLQNDKSTYLHGIAELSRTMRERLAKDQAEGLANVLRSFEKRYPRIGGMDRVWTDLEQWNPIRKAIRDKNLDAALRLSRHTHFTTPLFRAAAQTQIAAKLPPPEIAAEYEKAENAWSEGNWDHAFSILQGLTNHPWGEVARQRLQRYRTVLNEYKSLQQARGSNGYGQRLLAFYNRLDPIVDAKLRSALENDSQRYREQVLVEVRNEFEQASNAWSAYQAKGGIGGLLRLEDVVSDSFKQQAKRLSHAFEQAGTMMHNYELLQKQAPQESKQLYEDIFAEVKRQRQWLEDMRIVMNASLLKAKLALLPQPLEEER